MALQEEWGKELGIAVLMGEWAREHGTAVLQVQILNEYRKYNM